MTYTNQFETEQNNQLMELTNEQAEQLSGGRFVPSPPKGRRGNPPNLPLPRTGGVAPAAEATALSTIASLFAI